MSKHTQDTRSQQKDRPGLKKAAIALVQGTAVAAVYFGLFSILAYPVVDAAGLL